VADAIFRAAHGRRREYWIGRSTVMVILGSMVAPAFLDRYLARNAYDAQDRAAAAAPDRRDNLFAPVSGLHRCRGSFSTEARGSVQLFSGLAVRAVLVAGVAVCVGSLAVLAVL
jgi:hypothetical protein